MASCTLLLPDAQGGSDMRTRQEVLIPQEEIDRQLDICRQVARRSAARAAGLPVLEL